MMGGQVELTVEVPLWGQRCCQLYVRVTTDMLASEADELHGGVSGALA
jgi:hypothetical protein